MSGPSQPLHDLCPPPPLPLPRPLPQVPSLLPLPLAVAAVTLWLTSSHLVATVAAVASLSFNQIPSHRPHSRAAPPLKPAAVAAVLPIAIIAVAFKATKRTAAESQQ
jgi:hypothetical protein